MNVTILLTEQLSLFEFACATELLYPALTLKNGTIHALYLSLPTTVKTFVKQV